MVDCVWQRWQLKSLLCHELKVCLNGKIMKIIEVKDGFRIARFDEANFETRLKPL